MTATWMKKSLNFFSNKNNYQSSSIAANDEFSYVINPTPESIKKIESDIRKENSTAKTYTPQNRNFLSTQVKKIYDFGTTSFYNIKDKLANIITNSLSTKFTKTFNFLSNKYAELVDNILEKDLKEAFNSTLNNTLIKIITSIASSKKLEKLIIDNISNDKLITLINTIDDDQILNIIAKIPDNKFLTIFSCTKNDKLTKMFIKIAEVEPYKILNIQKNKLLKLIDIALNDERILNIIFEIPTEKIIKLINIILNESLEKTFSYILNDKLAKIITLSKDLEKIIKNISDEKLIKLIDIALDEDAEKIIDNISIKKLVEIINIAPNETLEKIAEDISDENLSKIIPHLSKEKLVTILTLIPGEEIVEQLKKQQDVKYNSENNFLCVDVLNDSNKFGFNSDDDSGIGSDDENSDTEPLGVINSIN